MKNLLSDLRSKQMSMNSINLDYPFWVKIGQAFLNLFIGGNGMIVCSESTIVRNDVYHSVQDSPILFQWSVSLCSSTRLLRPLLLNLSLLELTS